MAEDVDGGDTRPTASNMSTRGAGASLAGRKVQLLDEFGVRDLFTDRSVCVVGNAATLLRWPQQEKIDSHDVVVRINDFVIDDDSRPYVGAKTDIIVVNNHIAKIWSGEDFAELLRRYDCKVLLSKWEGFFIYLKLVAVAPEADFKVGSLFRSEFLDAFGNDYMTRFMTTGSFAAAMLLLSTELRSLHATGFDFYCSDQHYYQDDRHVVDTNHDRRKEMAYWQKTIFPDRRVTMDPVMRELMSAPLPDDSDERGDPRYPPPPLVEMDATVKTLDLRHLRQEVLEVNCDSNHWQVLLGRHCPKTRVVMTADCEVLYLVLPPTASCDLRLRDARTQVLSPDPRLQRHSPRQYSIVEDDPGAPVFDVLLDDNIPLLLILLRWSDKLVGSATGG